MAAKDYISESDIRDAGTHLVEHIVIHEYASREWRIEVRHSHHDDLLRLVRREDRFKKNPPSKVFYHRERMLRRLAKLFPHINSVDILQVQPLMQVELDAYRQDEK